ncbi:hypothetical protein JCM1393_27270 [Clostridium carnis]
MNKMVKKMKKKLHKNKLKSNILMEMAEDFMDIIHDAKLYKKIKK